jgi:hypothetical protein
MDGGDPGLVVWRPESSGNFCPQKRVTILDFSGRPVPTGRDGKLIPALLHGRIQMPSEFTRDCRHCLLAVCCLLWGMTAAIRAELPNPVLHTVFPPGGQAGTSVTVAVEGVALEGARDLRSTIPRLLVKQTDARHFTLTLPAKTPPGTYDLRAIGLHGMSSPRAFFVSNRTECLEKEPNDAIDTAQQLSLDVVVNGRIDKPGDVDCYRFDARSGQRVVLECWARRIDSQLRAVLEVFDARGKRLAVNRGYAGLDPLVDFLVPADGTYFVKVFDLSFLGGTAHFYRLDLDTKPRVEFALPCVVQRGKTTRVTLFGRNLSSRESRPRAEGGLKLDTVQVEVTPPPAGRDELIPFPLRPAQLAAEVFPYYYPGGHAPVLIGVTDVPVVACVGDNRLPDKAQEITVPCAVSGQLTDGDERHWYAVQVHRGEVFWLEGFGERLGSPVELAVAVLDPAGQRELVQLAECLDNLGQARFPTAHADPAGRWVAPADGRYLIVVRNQIGGPNRDPRRIYQLSVRREEPDFHLAVVSRRVDQPAGLNVGVGGREMVEVLALRRNGLTGPIRVTAEQLPPGIQCPDVWIGPGQNHAPLVVTASRGCSAFAGALKLVGHTDLGGAAITRAVRGGTIVWSGQPTPCARLTQEIPLATAPEAPILLTASPSEMVVDQESVLDVTIDVEQRFEGSASPIHLSGVELPRGVRNTLVTIPAGKTKGTISFFIPESLAPGPYTFAVQAETEVPVASGTPNGKPGKASVRLVTNPITIHVRPARIVLEIDPRTPHKIARGKIVELRFAAERKHGFIGKIHTELAAPGGVVGLRARGVTLVGRSDSGVLQIIATETAPLGRQPFLRLEAVGTVEDQPVYRASRFVELEITE